MFSQVCRLNAHLQNPLWQPVLFTALIHPFTEWLPFDWRRHQSTWHFLPTEEEQISRRSDLLTSLIGSGINWPLFFNPQKVPFYCPVSTSNVLGVGLVPHNFLHCWQCWWSSWAGTPWTPAGRFVSSSAGFVLKGQAFIIAATSSDEACMVWKVQDTKSWYCFFLLYRSLISSILQSLLAHLQQALLSAWKYPLHLHWNQQELQLRTTLRFQPSPFRLPWFLRCGDGCQRKRALFRRGGRPNKRAETCPFTRHPNPLCLDKNKNTGVPLGISASRRLWTGLPVK